MACYIVKRQRAPGHQLSFLELMLDLPEELKPDASPSDLVGTVTHLRETPTADEIRRAGIPRLIDLLEAFNRKYEHLFQAPRESLYRTFFIPKHSGGLRRIDAPCGELMGALRELKELFEVNMGPLYHTAAFAYVPGRCAVDAVRRHQRNESRWFLKSDFTDFFGSTNEGFLCRAIERVFPFSEISRYVPGKRALEKALSLCTLRGGLPQGTPVSPMLTNLVMIPIDHELFNALARKHMVYTRYADDILISSRFEFKAQEVVDFISWVVGKHEAPYQIKPQKTRYGSSSGSNWNLGVMLNKDNNITIGHQKKKQFHAMVDSFIRDHQSHHPWSLEDVQHLSGLLSYYIMVERDCIQQIIQKYNQKYHADFRLMLKLALKGECL